MPEEAVDREIEAIREVLAALTPLSEVARISVLEYVTKRLDLKLSGQVDSQPDDSSGEPPSEDSQTPMHIKTLKEQKKPRSANEMAALVAYYLANISAKSNRKTSIDQSDIETYFKIAEFPLPKQVRNTLPNAKAAGYFDLLGEGEYKLNAVGHNLVAHAMPRGSARTPAKRKTKTRKTKPKSKAGGRKRKA